MRRYCLSNALCRRRIMLTVTYGITIAKSNKIAPIISILPPPTAPSLSPPDSCSGRRFRLQCAKSKSRIPATLSTSRGYAEHLDKSGTRNVHGAVIVPTASGDKQPQCFLFGFGREHFHGPIHPLA